MPAVDNVPETKRTAPSESPRAASYDTICAVARTEPSNGYFEPLDHPASMMPYTAMEEIAKANNTPIGGSANCNRV